jgi:hypothetical protein
MSNDRDNEPFLSRWSRQKQLQAQKPERKAAPVETPAEPEREIDLSKLTKVEDLTAESDITQFLQKGVPEALQKLALRKMWSLDPAIRDFVEVAENQWDFNMPGGIHGLYQDITEGTDVSVWMAQATQSVLGDEAKKTTDVADLPTTDANLTDDKAAAAQNVAMQQNQEDVAEGALIAAAGSADPKPAAGGQIGSVKQRTEVAEKSDAPPTKRPAETLAVRRRHGGALPA